jgi:hypothetical protein
MVNVVLSRYPGSSLSHAGSDFWNVMRLIGISAAIRLGVGAAGLVVGFGLLRLRTWARDAALAWCLGSSLLFVIILATPQSLLGVRPNPTGMLLFLLFIAGTSTPCGISKASRRKQLTSTSCALLLSITPTRTPMRAAKRSYGNPSTISPASTITLAAGGSPPLVKAATQIPGFPNAELDRLAQIKLPCPWKA